MVAQVLRFLCLPQFPAFLFAPRFVYFATDEDHSTVIETSGSVFVVFWLVFCCCHVFSWVFTVTLSLTKARIFAAHF